MLTQLNGSRNLEAGLQQRYTWTFSLVSLQIEITSLVRVKRHSCGIFNPSLFMFSDNAMVVFLEWTSKILSSTLTRGLLLNDDTNFSTVWEICIGVQ